MWNPLRRAIITLRSPSRRGANPWPRGVSPFPQRFRRVAGGPASRSSRATTSAVVGSTPTAVLAGGFPGATEIRPGNFVFFDRFQADMGVCSLGDCSATVAATVIGRYEERNRILVDAGALARALADDVAALVLQSPNYFGVLENLGDLAGPVKDAGALLLVHSEPTSLALLEPPGSFGAAEKSRTRSA